MYLRWAAWRLFTSLIIIVEILVIWERLSHPRISRLEKWYPRVTLIIEEDVHKEIKEGSSEVEDVGELVIQVEEQYIQAKRLSIKMIGINVIPLWERTR